MRIVDNQLADTSPQARGRAHGEQFRSEIAEIAAIRTHLTMIRPQWDRVEDLYRIAAAHMPLMDTYSPALAAELRGIAEGANASIEDVVIVNHYTDLRDIEPEGRPAGTPVATAEALHDLDQDEGCTAVYSPNGDHPFLGMTWDTHYSAADFLCMLPVPRVDGEPAAWSYTITGCLGMAGMNEAGVSVVVNNLICTDARIGVLWPAVIRRILACRTVQDAVAVVKATALGSGHHYLIAGPDGVAAIETSGTMLATVHSDRDRYFHHTNHGLHPGVEPFTRISPTSSTKRRYATMGAQLDAALPTNFDSFWDGFGTVCEPEKDHANKVATCGLVAMDMTARRSRALKGHDMRNESFDFGFNDGQPVRSET